MAQDALFRLVSHDYLETIGARMLLASFLPARRAAAMDPMQVLRTE